MEKREMNFFELIIAVFNGIKNFFKGLLNLSCQTIKLVFNYFWLMLIITALAVVLGYFSTQSPKRIYKAHNIITFSKEARQSVENEFYVLNTLSAFDREKLAERMNLTIADISSIIEFKTYPIIDLRNDSIADIIVFKPKFEMFIDTLHPAMTDRMGIRIYLKGTADTDKIAEGLIHYFNHHPSISKIDEASKAMIDERIAFCITELNRLDKFSDYDYFGGGTKTIKSERSGIVMEPSRKKLYYENMRDLLKEKSYLTTLKAENPNVINFVSDKFWIWTFPRLYMLIIYVFIGVCVGLLAALIFKYRKNIWMYLKK
jgi:hypothetical protein